jgi:polysaccharide deacetylase family protein (PEP-CTERM system associated)
MASTDNARQVHGKAGKRLNAMTVDVEDYFHAEALLSVRGDASLPVRFEASTGRLLDLFAARGVRATFFTLGWVAKEAPGLVRRIVEEGHELAAHGFSHVRITDQSPQDFRLDIARAKDVLEQAAGTAVRGYRAPTFSIGPATQWAYEILADEGFCWSSSVYPVAHDLYGMPGAPRVPWFPVEGLDFPEIPMSTVDLGGRIMQGGGGGYFRLLPYALSAWLVRRVNGRDEQPFMFYCHPWEVDVGQPRIAGLPLKSRIRHYTNLSRMEAKLERLTQDFSWGRVDEVFEVARVPVQSAEPVATPESSAL